MSEQELKRLKRSEILEIMVEQTKAVQAMRAETDQIKEQLEDYRERVKEQNETITRLRAGIVSGSAESEEESKQLDLVYKQIEQKIRGQRARIKELEAEVVRLKKELKSKTEELEKVKGSGHAEPEKDKTFRHAEPETEEKPPVSVAAPAESAPDATIQMNMLLDDAKRAANALSRRARWHSVNDGGENE